MPEISTINRTYNEVIKKADDLSKSKDLDLSFDQYKKALLIKPDSEYVIERLSKLNKIFDLRK